MDVDPTFDLQSHSTASDGTLPPAEVVRAAAAAGVEVLALTDHDTVAGVAPAIEAAVGTEFDAFGVKELRLGGRPAVAECVLTALVRLVVQPGDRGDHTVR